MKSSKYIIAGILALTMTSANAADEFSVLDGIEAEALNSEEMDQVQGRFVGNLVAANLAMDASFFDWAGSTVTGLYNQAQQIRAQTGYYGPWNWSGTSAQTLSNSIAGLQSAYDSYNQGWAANQQTNAALANNFSQYIRGVGNFANPATGGVSVLPIHSFGAVGYNPTASGNFVQTNTFGPSTLTPLF